MLSREITLLQSDNFRLALRRVPDLNMLHAIWHIYDPLWADSKYILHQFSHLKTNHS